MFAAMSEAGEAPPRAVGAGGGRRRHRDAVPRRRFDRVIAAEVLEHIPADQAAMNEIARVLRAGRRRRGHRAGWLPERICWGCPTTTTTSRAGTCASTPGPSSRPSSPGPGLAVGGHHHAHGLHSPYWWLKCAVGVHDDDHPLARAYHRLLVWDIMKRPPPPGSPSGRSTR